MRTNQGIELSQPKDDILSCLTADCCRRILTILREQSAPVTEEELARELGAVERETATAEGSEDDSTRIQIRLRHTHLPKLNDVGLVEWNRTQGTVQMADHPAVDDPWFEQFLDAADDESDQLIACLADECRRTVLDVLESNGGELRFEKLARVVSHRVTRLGSDSNIRTLLHHAHLPRLDEAGLVDYHGTDGRVELNPNRPRFSIEGVY